MMKLALLLSAIAGASAFAPAPQAQQATALGSLSVDAEYQDDIGCTAPLGVWDPSGKLGMGKEEVARLRAVELKHGRVSMLAFLGYIVTYAGARIPGLEDVPAGWAAVTGGAIPLRVAGEMVIATMMMEIANRDHTGEAEFPGDFRNGYLDFGWDKFSEETKLRKRSIELNNGRAAMMGITGLMFHDALGNVSDILPF